MERIELKRTGARPLAFEGERIAHSHGQTESGPCNTRYWNIEVYRTKAGKWVLALAWHTSWQGEEDYFEALAFEHAYAIAQTLERANPTARLVGFPPGPSYADKQARLIDAITTRWGAQVAEILGHLGVAEEVE